MVFDDSFFQVAKGKSTAQPTEYKPFSSFNIDLDSEESDNAEEASTQDVSEEAPVEETTSSEQSDSSTSAEEATPAASTPQMADLTSIPSTIWSSEYGNPDQDYVIESDIVVPCISAKKEEIPSIVVIDDDFDTLDLLKIYLARGYEYSPFHGPREAIFYLNEHIPDLILLDSNIHTIKATKVIEIIRSYKDLKDTPIVYTCDESEKQFVMENLPEEVCGLISRPVSRGNLQYILDKFVLKVQ